MKREAKAKNGFYIEPEAKLLFVIRIRGINDMAPKTKKILQLLRLRRINTGVFLKVCVGLGARSYPCRAGLVGQRMQCRVGSAPNGPAQRSKAARKQQ